MLCLSFVPKHALPRWFYSFVSGFWKNWYGYIIFFKNLLLQFFSKLYQGDQILRLYIYKLCFQFCIPPPLKGQSSFFLQLHGCAWWLLELISFLLYDLMIFPILCATVAYLHIIPFENFMELVWRWKKQISLLKEFLCNICNDCMTIRQLNHMMLQWCCHFTWLVLDLLERQVNVTVTTTF